MGAGRRCPGHRCPIIVQPPRKYCDAHAREYEARRGTSTQRGYGAAHQRARAKVQARIDAGEIVRCVDCSVRLHGHAWDMGHVDGTRTRYKGPQCIPCNRRAGGKIGRAKQS